MVVDSDGIKNYKLIISKFQPVWRLQAVCEMGDKLSIVGEKGEVTRVHYSTQSSSGTRTLPMK